MAEESRGQSKILKDLRSSKYRKYCRCTKIEKASDNGFPDIFFTTALTGAVLLEAKAKKGIASESQKEFVKGLNSCGTKSFICSSWEQWVEIKKHLGMNDLKNLENAHNSCNGMLS